ncbi:hypothetical protein SBV1_2980021 [Verrucomicrobia bacterium]|nr:hypothetical protein SBV1_2980021 [Verrucomicrobiota bacterium]
MTDEGIEIQKRHTLNWLIQGSAQHAGMTFHHLVRDELNALEPRLVRLYDQYALINLLQYWQFTSAVVLGWPPRFWRQAASKRRHPFFGHPLLSKYGGTLAEAGRRRAMLRCKEKGLTTLPFAFSFQTMFVISRLLRLERPHRSRLVELAKKATSTVWGIPTERLVGDLSNQMVLQTNLIPCRSARDALFRACMVGYGGVVRRGHNLVVLGRGTNWQLLAKELVKGTAELICLHGLSGLSDELYRRVIDTTDRLALEPWMLQSGAELWGRLLAALPSDRPLARVLMHLARLPARTLESMIAEIIEAPERAQARLAGLGEGTCR